MSRRRKVEDHYAVLGVARTASPEEIKLAFKARAKAIHPDKNRHRDTTQEFQRLQGAYAVLDDPEQRQLYDLETSPSGSDQPNPGGHRAMGTGWPRPLRYLAVGLAIGGAVFGAIYFFSPPAPSDARGALAPAQANATPELPGLDHEMQAAILQNAQNYAGTETGAVTEVEVAGRDGRKYVVAGVIARELEPARNKLYSVSEELQTRAGILKSRRDLLERERRSLDPSQVTAIKSFNDRVEVLNRDSADLDRDAQTHSREIEAFFVELERVALRVR